MRQPNDLKGKQFGLLVALTRERVGRRTKWLCQCRCGNQKLIREEALLNGRSKSCGCSSDKIRSAKYEKRYSLVNQRFGRLTVLWRVKEGNGYSRSMMWECKCDCGETIKVPATRLRSGKTQSCGCMLHELWLQPGQAVRNTVLSRYRSSAKKRNLEWALSEGQFNTLLDGDCHYCGEPPTRYTKVKNCRGEFFYNGIDRLNNHNGYVVGNVVSCCYACNLMKRASSPVAFLIHVKKIAQQWARRDVTKVGVPNG